MFASLQVHLTQLTFHGLLSWYVLTYYWSWAMSLLAGLLLPVIYFDKPDKVEEDSITRRALIAVSVLLILLGTLSPVTVPWLMNTLQSSYAMDPFSLSYPLLDDFAIVLVLVGIVVHVIVRRRFEPAINRLLLRFNQKTHLARDSRTDVRTIRDHLPDTMDYDPEQYIDLKKGVFVGLDVHQQPQYIPLSDIQKQHCGFIGTTGSGKGVASGLILYQLILAGEGAFVLDPKNDEWAPHLMRYACEKAGKPFHLINLNEKVPQLDLLAGTDTDQIEELLVAGFSLAEKGDNSDFYRIDDRKAARKSPVLASDYERGSLERLFQSDYVQSIEDNIKAFYGKLEELSLVTSVNAVGGVNLNRIYEEGGCCYIIGSMRNAKILIAQKMILIRLLQIAETRDRIHSKPRPIAIFLDELKYHISRPAMEGLGAARDKGVHIFLAFQSIPDLKDCPADLSGEAVVGSVVENTKFKLVYRLQDPDTAEWIAKMSGTILVDDETRYIESSKALSEKVELKRNIRMAERAFVDENMLQNLPDKVSYIFTTNDVPKPSLVSPVMVKKRDLSLATLSIVEPVIHKEQYHDEPVTESPTRPHDHASDAPTLPNLDEPMDLMAHALDDDESDFTLDSMRLDEAPIDPHEQQAMLDALDQDMEEHR